MAEYIDREAVLKILADNCPHDKGGYNTEEEMGAGSACYYIRRAVEIVPAADVVPKIEVERLEQILNSYALQYGTVKDQQAVIDKAKTEVARDISGIIEQRMARNIERMNGCQSDIWKVGYLAENKAYQDIKEIIEQKYTEVAE